MTQPVRTWSSWARRGRWACAVALAFALTAACEAGGDDDDDDEGGTDGAGGQPTGACETGTFWRGGDHESPLMHPGRTCIQCHTDRREGPKFAVAGTLFRALHDVNDCNGANGKQDGIKVVITDANQKVITLSVNEAGNFYFEGSIAKPYRAKVVVGDMEAEMSKPQQSGDCNGCHTETGAMDAPGRILVP